MNRRSRRGASRNSRGFSLLELLMSMGIILIVSGATVSVLTAHQKVYTSTAMKADMHAGMRSATELLAQEVGQAGLLAPPCASPGATCATVTTLSAAVSANSNAQTVSVSSTTGMFVGEILQIDLGAAQEAVTITAIGTGNIRGIFSQSHSSGALVNATGAFPQGVLSSSTSTQLQMFGDINADGNMVYVRYDCDTTAGTLSRSVTPITASASNTSVVLLDNIVPTSGSCSFQYSSTTVSGHTFVTAVGVTLSVQTSQLDPQTGQFDTETKTLLNQTPRNIVAGVALANAGLTDHLQPTPPNLPLP